MSRKRVRKQNQAQQLKRTDSEFKVVSGASTAKPGKVISVAASLFVILLTVLAFSMLYIVWAQFAVMIALGMVENGLIEGTIDVTIVTAGMLGGGASAFIVLLPKAYKVLKKQLFIRPFYWAQRKISEMQSKKSKKAVSSDTKEAA